MLDQGMGLWVHIPGGVSVDLPLAGTTPVGTTDIILKKGWNLVGYPYDGAPQDASTALAGVSWDLIQICDQTRPYNLKSVSGSYIMEAGKGYWIHVTDDTTWTV